MSLHRIELVTLAEANEALVQIGHYLGPSNRGTWCWLDEFGVMVWASPTSRRLPAGRVIELVRWGLRGRLNGGSQQWARWRRWAADALPHSTCVSYSDPSVGHTGALYRACNWQWVPTWHRLRPPPTGNGSWDGVRVQSVKDRWAFALRPDSGWNNWFAVRDESVVRRGIPAYREFQQMNQNMAGTRKGRAA